jgi:hypothetical protein
VHLKYQLRHQQLQLMRHLAVLQQHDQAHSALLKRAAKLAGLRERERHRVYETEESQAPHAATRRWNRSTWRHDDAAPREAGTPRCSPLHRQHTLAGLMAGGDRPGGRRCTLRAGRT